jgi:hypothetical protein
MKFIPSFAIIILLFGCKGKPPENCKDFRTGKFMFKESSVNRDLLIVRNDSIQIEYDSKEKTSIEFHIKWINECRYELEPTLKSDPDKRLPIVTVEITGTRNNEYDYAAYTRLSVSRGTLIKQE